MKLQTPVTDEICKVGISYDDKILMMGSCFSDNIGRQLADFGFDVCINPFGTLYNPVSLLESVRLLTSDRRFGPEDCIEIGAGDSRTCSFSHHTSFARTSAEEFISDANAALDKAREFFRECRKVIITLGTSWCFRHIETDRVVSNCLKRPAGEFRREFLTASQTGGALKEIIRLCNCSSDASGAPVRPKEFIFTVSPIRHFKDGAHGNQISKASLLLGVEEALAWASCMEEPVPADYFPAYEIMMDELRDYRFYAEDMCHPSQQTVNYIRERFLSWALPASEHGLLEDNIRAFRSRSHVVLSRPGQK